MGGAGTDFDLVDRPCLDHAAGEGVCLAGQGIGEDRNSWEVAVVGPEVEVLCHWVGLVVADAQPALQTEERQKEQMRVRNQVDEAVHLANPRKRKHDDGQ